MDDSNKQRVKSELERKKRDLESRISSIQGQLRSFYRTLESGKPLNGSEESTKNRLEKENDDCDRQIKEIKRAASQI
ncbi:MAG: hypothetical protein WC475_00940 [Candidatus Paceibacterota bacterium]